MRSRSLAVYEQADREVVGSIRAFEETEPLSVRPLFWVETGLRPARSSAHTDWVVFLLRRGVLVEEVQWHSRLAEAYGVAIVPRWVNDLCCALRTSKRMYEQGRLTPLTPDQEEAVRLVSRAVRAAQRAPAFRIALTAKCSELCTVSITNHMTVDGDALVPLGRAVLAWLQARDWSDARPGMLFQ
jgi:hypothetical protein